MVLADVRPVPKKPKAGRKADPCVMVIFGFTGDLTRRKLIPALYNLASQQLLSPEFAVIGVGRSPMSDEAARQKVTEDFKKFATGAVDKDLWEWFVGANQLCKRRCRRPRDLRQAESSVGQCQSAIQLTW
jgi:glucose-6-phosphate 1-dehydrogenase